MPRHRTELHLTQIALPKGTAATAGGSLLPGSGPPLRRFGVTVPHPDVLGDKLKHNKMIILLKKKKNDPRPSGAGPQHSPVCPPRGEAWLVHGPTRYWLLQPCEAEEPLPACFFLRLLSSRLLEVFRSLICTWS